MNTKNRPKWARKLKVSEWNHLAECQGRKPSLARLREDVAQQKANGVTCWDCLKALGKAL